MSILSLLYVRWRCRKLPADYVTKMIVEAFIKDELKKSGLK